MGVFLTQNLMSKFTAAMIRFLLLAPVLSISVWALECDDLLRTHPFIKQEIGYPAEINAIDLSLGHTIRNPTEFVRENLGGEVVEAANQPKINFHIFVGDGKDAYLEALKRGWKIHHRVEKSTGFQQVYLAEKDGITSYLIFRVNGDDRIRHIQSLLKLVDVPPERVFTVGETQRWTKTYLEAFQRTGEKPDLVIYGFVYHTLESVLEIDSVSNYKFIAEMNAGKKLRSMTPNLLEDSDLKSVQMHSLRMKNGKIIWLFNNLYGDLSKDLLNALVDYKVERIVYGGTAGALTSKFKVADIVTPESALYQIAPAIGVQTNRWVNKKIKEGVEVVEMELGYWLGVLRIHPEIDFAPFLEISNVMSGKNIHDYSDIDMEGASPLALALKSKVLELIKRKLGIVDKQGFRVKSYKKFPLN